MTKKQMSTLFLLFLGYSIVYLDKQSMAFSLIPFTDLYGFTETQKGAIVSMFYLGIGLMQIPIGFLLNKLNTKWVIVTSLVIIGVTAIIFSSLSGSLFLFIAVRFISGMFGHTAYPPAATLAVNKVMPEDKKSFAQSILLSSLGVAALAGPVLFASLAETNWRAIYWIVAFFALVAAVGFTFLMPNIESAKVDETEPDLPIRQILNNPNLWIMSAGAACVNFIVIGAANLMPTYLSVNKGLEMSSLGIVAAAAGIFLLIGGIGSSFVINKWFKGKEGHFVGLSMIAGVAIICLMPLIPAGNDGKLGLFLIMSAGNLLTNAAFTVLYSMPLAMFKGKAFSPSFGVFSLGGIFGCVTPSVIIGAILDATGMDYKWMFIAFVVCAVILYILMMSLRDHRIEGGVKADYRKRDVVHVVNKYHLR
ncbi:MFS transporter [Vagococcus coleopterorum]|uniref:MFS transporter n=1 Tax=Vagococcus coleopterorum TaxID=2714946 RepID=A0A6G8AME9_9ENTE|nr:MFS transporter [Vagococcus coleopterorum]QIL46238.1 MFS transporter [Vagococcus coleopterorum]